MHSKPFHPRALFACRLLAALMASLALMACGKAEPAKAEPAAPAEASRPGPVIGTDQAPTPEALFDTVSARARRGDTVGLARLLVDDSVFRRNVYPISPAYDSSSESVFEFVAGLHKTNSAKGLKRLLADAAQNPGPDLRIPNAKVIRTSEGILYEAAEYSGSLAGLQLYGAVLCRASGCQVVSYAPAGARGG